MEKMMVPASSEVNVSAKLIMITVITMMVMLIMAMMTKLMVVASKEVKVMVMIGGGPYDESILGSIVPELKGNNIAEIFC